MTPRVWILLVLALCLFKPPAAWAENKEEFEERLRTEVTTVLDKYLGIGNSQVVVLVDGEPSLMVPPITKIGERASGKMDKSKKNDNAQMLWSDYSTRSRRSLMPGFSARQEMVVREDPKAPPAAPQDRKKEDIPEGMEPVVLWKVKRILVSVVLDRSVDEASAQKVGAMVMDMLGLDPDRGDKLNVYKLPLKSPLDLFLTSPSSWLTFVKWGIILLLAGIFCWGLYRLWPKLLRFFRKKEFEVDLNQGAEELGEDGLEDGKDTLEPQALALEGPNAGQPLGGPGIALAMNGNGNGKVKHSLMERLKAFTFVTKNNAQLLGEVISKDEDVQLAVLASFLDPGLGSVVLNQLDAEKRKRVLVTMSDASHVNPEALKKLEAEVELRLQYAVGGTESVSDIICQMAPQEQNEVVKALWQKDQALATKVYQMIFRFEDLFQLPERELRILAESIPMADWVSALSGTHPSYAQALARVLPEETREVFRQHMEMSGAKSGSMDVRWKILKVAKELQGQGRIQLKKPQTATQKKADATVTVRKE